MIVGALVGLTGCAPGPLVPPGPLVASAPPVASAPAAAIPATATLATGTPATTTRVPARISSARTTSGGSLRGKVIVIDPGHNGANWRNPRRINRTVSIGNGRKVCDTTGTQTDAGYPESMFTFDVATRLATALRARGATVVLTRPDNRGIGPCINERAAIGNRAHADVAISIHADGAPASGYGFHVIVPRGIGRNDAVVAPSRRLGVVVRDAFRRGTGEPLSTYAGTRTGGIVARSDLGGLNLSTVPKVFIECGNMRNRADARRISSPAWRRRAATALASGLTAHLTSSR